MMKEPPLSDPPWVRSGDEGAATDESATDAVPESRDVPAPDQPKTETAAEGPSADAEKTETPRKRSKKRKKRSYTRAVAQALLDGEREASIVSWLQEKGLDDEQIEHALSRARAVIRLKDEPPDEADAGYAMAEADARARRQRDITVGALWFGGGALLTIMTFASASQSGGHYVLAWGPMIYGGIRLLKAL